jgi:hypothetical protein
MQALPLALEVMNQRRLGELQVRDERKAKLPVTHRPNEGRMNPPSERRETPTTATRAAQSARASSRVKNRPGGASFNALLAPTLTRVRSPVGQSLDAALEPK